VNRTAEIVTAIKNEIGNTPLIIKIAYFEDQKQLEKLVNLVGKTVDGISAINTIPSKIYNEKGEQALPGENRLVSGVCGYPIKWAGLEMVKRLKALREEKGMKFIILGVGGVTDVKDYFEYRAIGADAVMSATGAMWNPLLAQEIKSQV
jgi:dihydroorotate dehydrogenase